MLAERIRFLREEMNLSQSELAKILGVTRSGIHSYEQSISTPSVRVLIAMAELFRVSTDFLLGLDDTATLKLEGLTEEDKQVVYALVSHLRGRGKDAEK